jgi:hypothetical protein
MVRTTKRARLVRVLLNDSEFETLVRAAERESKTLSELIRELIRKLR